MTSAATLANSKEKVAVKNLNTANESEILPKKWIGNQAYSVDLLNKNETIYLVPFAEASQTEGDMKVWLPITVIKR